MKFGVKRRVSVEMISVSDEGSTYFLLNEGIHQPSEARYSPLEDVFAATSLSEEVPNQTGITSEDEQKLPPRGCKSCGREEMERGCNGEGRIQGGTATVPGFGWWPIKAYRSCPGFVESGGRYRRHGEVAWGRGVREATSVDQVQPRSIPSVVVIYSNMGNVTSNAHCYLEAYFLQQKQDII
ncbi:hypothetical protein IFM89_022003 [Coptis chinensis]|uniref:Uncharacterized protein n=1 Tax=Coptis chinensis TaxID=261450 RepID=A0A835I6V5_9MAGN|nr:hypothetical protein IFM89_022003 [Coptis chinensis]